MNWVIICDETSALGWRLAGARAVIADPRNTEEHLAEARRHADLVFITANLSSHLPPALLGAALLAEKPLMLVIPAVAGGDQPADLERDAQHLLGIAV
jgi:vacuolar-type H+-ATPase subunit F/Vma7